MKFHEEDEGGFFEDIEDVDLDAFCTDCGERLASEELDDLKCPFCGGDLASRRVSV